MQNDPANDLDRLRRDGTVALADLFAQYRSRLERMVEFRLDRRLLGRVDSADVLQEAFVTISHRLESYLEAATISPFVWIRQLTLQTIVDLHRQHFRQKRGADREVPLLARTYDGTSYSIAHALVANQTSPSCALVRAEEIDQLRSGLESMEAIDREVLALRHFEQLSNQETAEALAISVTAASNRYVRAMQRLSEIMQPKST